MSATGASESAGSGFPFGRPRWEAMSTRPPSCSRRRRVGRTSRMRVSSVTRRGVDACLFALLREIDGAAQEHAEPAPAWQP